MVYRFATAMVAAACLSAAPKFYPDDPLIREPQPMDVQDAQARKISDWYDLFSHVFATPGEKHKPGAAATEALDVNTLGEVMDGAWYENRHYRKRMSLDELKAGPGVSNPPSKTGQWTVISAKTEGVTPGFVIEDDGGRRYFVKFDPVRFPELATAADVISSKFFYALGYHVPQNYIVRFDRDRLTLSSRATFRDIKGRKRTLTSKDLGEILLRAPRGPDGLYRASASLVIPGKILNEYRYFGTRTDDPNDTIPHEHRRSLRGLYVFCAWLVHEDSRSINTLDALVEESGRKYVKHYLLDFGSTLGSASYIPNSPRSGFEQLFTWRSSAKEFFTLGLYIPRWSKIDYPSLQGVGRFTAEQFDPIAWTPEYPNPAFNNRLPSDNFWAARQVMNFTDEEIRAIVRTGELSDPEAERYVADTIIRRRDAIGRAYLAKGLQLDRFRIEGGSVEFDDLSLKLRSTPPDPYVYSWFAYDNSTQRRTPLTGAQGRRVPTSAERFLALNIKSRSESSGLTIYLRNDSGVHTIIGVDRASN